MVYFDHLIQRRYAESHVYACRSRIGDVRTGSGQASGSRYKAFRYHAPVLESAVIMQSSQARLMLLTQTASRSRQSTVHKKTLVIMAVMQSFALRPLRDSHDWPLWGDEYGRMKVGNALLFLITVSFCLMFWHIYAHESH